VEPTNFQSKFKHAEERALRLSLPGAHSSGLGEEGENFPDWVSNPSKAAVEDQK
jgi:hypothetical protein